MRKQNFQHIWQYFQRHRVASIAIAHGCVLMVLGLVLLGNTLGSTILGAFAQSGCASGDSSYFVHSGDTLGLISSRYNMSWQTVASHNHIGNPNFIYVGQRICIPGHGSTASGGSGNGSWGSAPASGSYNPYPWGECTSWADYRFHQLHGVFVPWMFNSNAWLWSYRAQQYHWRVSSIPTVGSIIALQAWTQGAYSYGHVGVVERILPNGDVVASSMNWGLYPWSVSYTTFVPGYGVSFISY
ncbi:MAG: LysM peptidoglycan-binding domain-containing protein [Chloroflexota bacterium]|nr:LysM peptidoglycan-binding domain-containing protein [Chloroflexota bacterium]